MIRDVAKCRFLQEPQGWRGNPISLTVQADRDAVKIKLDDATGLVYFHRNERVTVFHAGAFAWIDLRPLESKQSDVKVVEMKKP